MKVIGLALAMNETVNYEADDVSPICAGVDISVDVQKNSNKLILRTSVTAIDITLRYREWVSFLDVLRLNLGRKLDRSLWDNLEVAWEAGREFNEESDTILDCTTPRFSKDVPYSENARHVRFGTKTKSVHSDMHAHVLDLTVSCDGVAVLLHRDDLVSTQNGTSAGHDLVLLVLHCPRFSLARQSSGQQTTSISVGEFCLFDLAGHRRPCGIGCVEFVKPISPFLVLVEGYVHDDRKVNFDSQIVLTIDQPDPTSQNFCMNLLMTGISVAVLSRAIEDIVFFVACRWDSGDSTGSPSGFNSVTKSTDENILTPQRTIQLKFVLHYPRFIFVADENDTNSRALVLEG